MTDVPRPVHLSIRHDAREARIASARGKRILTHDGAGVSNVLGAILMFGLLVLTLVVVQTEFVPVWDEDREARHMETVRDQFATVKSDLDRQVDNRTNLALTNPLTLQAGSGFRFFSGAGHQSAEFELTAGPGAVEVDSPRMTILQSGDTSFYGLAEEGDWVNVNSPPVDTYTDVTEVRALRLRIDMHEDVCDGYLQDDTAVLVVTDANGEEVGRALTTWLPASSSEWALRLDIFANFDGQAQANDQVSSDAEFFFQQLCQGSQENYLDYHYFDLLDPSLLFDAVINSATFPITIDIQQDGLVAAYIVVYDDSTGSTNSGAGGGLIGLTVEPYNPAPYQGGSLSFSAPNSRFVPQDYVLEHGAVLRVQEGQAAMVVAPSFVASLTDTTTSLAWTLPTLSGDASAIQGSRTASLVTTPSGSRVDIRATAAQITMVFATDYPDAWEDFLRLELRQAGLDEGNAEFTIDTSVPGQVTVLLEGVENDPDVDDLFFTFKQAEIQSELRA